MKRFRSPKRIAIFALAFFWLSVFSAGLQADTKHQAELRGEIGITTVFSAVEIDANGSSTSTALNLGKMVIRGYFSLQVTVSGDGTAKFEYLLSNDNVTYLEPSSASDIASGFTKNGGPGTDGNDLFSFSPEPAKWLKIKVTETGGANSITVTAYLAVQ